jgi:hypothetical protein
MEELLRETGQTAVALERPPPTSVPAVAHEHGTVHRIPRRAAGQSAFDAFESDDIP